MPLPAFSFLSKVIRFLKRVHVITSLASANATYEFSVLAQKTAETGTKVESTVALGFRTPRKIA